MLGPLRHHLLETLLILPVLKQQASAVHCAAHSRDQVVEVDWLGNVVIVLSCMGLSCMAFAAVDVSMTAVSIITARSGWPGAVVRGGTSPEGLPIGVQVVARPWREDVALAVVRHLEATLGGWQPPEL
jgi:Asp-tRNA(Asn)/Glu-tRNA(Gln) amidotransferase A subunit family amidase